MTDKNAPSLDGIIINDAVRAAAENLIAAQQRWQDGIAALTKDSDEIHDDPILNVNTYMRFSPQTKQFERAKDALRRAFQQANPLMDVSPADGKGVYTPHITNINLAPYLNQVVAEVAGERIKKIPEMFTAPETGPIIQQR